MGNGANCAPSAPVKSPKRGVPSKSEKGYRLEQQSRFLGPVVTEYTHSHFKFSCPRNSSSVIANAPDWKIFQYNALTKRYCELDLEHARPALFMMVAMFTGQGSFNVPFTQKKSITINGAPGVEYCTPANYAEHQKVLRRNRQIDVSAPSKVTLQVLSDPLIPKQPVAVSCRYFGVPAVEGMPYECNLFNMDNDRVKVIQTQTVTKTTFPASEFALPAGYKHVAKVDDLSRDPALYSDMNDFIQQGK